jgi:hypothetical protein
MAVLATFSDFKIVKGRKVAQLILEVPLEGAQAALTALGGVPQPDSAQWVGLAPVTEEAAQKPAEKPKGGKLAQRAGILCGEASFRKFMFERYGSSSTGADGAAIKLRHLCCVESRADLDHDLDAGAQFRIIEGQYRDWMRS